MNTNAAAPSYIEKFNLMLSKTHPPEIPTAYDNDDARKARLTLFRFKEIARQYVEFNDACIKLKASLPATSTRQSEFYLKRLNIDETFDPFDVRDCARIQSLFADTDGKNAPGREFSPVKLEIVFHHPLTGETCEAAGPRREGLWFREPTQV